MSTGEANSSASLPNEETALIISKSGVDEDTGVEPEKKRQKVTEVGFGWLMIFIFVLAAAFVVTGMTIAGTFAGPDDDDDGDGEDEGDSNVIVAKKASTTIPYHCTVESLTAFGEYNAVACHDPTGCTGANDTTEWCYVSDMETPFEWAVEHQALFEGINRTSDPLAIAGSTLSHLSPTCVVNACKHRTCNCKDNGNGTSHCEGIHKNDFPFTKVREGNYLNCETSENQVEKVDSSHTFEGKASNCACLDPTSCANQVQRAAYNGGTPLWVHRDTNVTTSSSDRCYVSVHHDAALDNCVPGACGMIFPCDCEQHDNGTSSCPTTFPFRDVEVVPNCEDL